MVSVLVRGDNNGVDDADEVAGGEVDEARGQSRQQRLITAERLQLFLTFSEAGGGGGPAAAAAAAVEAAAARREEDRGMGKTGKACLDIVACGRGSADHDDVEPAEVNPDPRRSPPVHSRS